jgi:hypothetical protein
VARRKRPAGLAARSRTSALSGGGQSETHWRCALCEGQKQEKQRRGRRRQPAGFGQRIGSFKNPTGIADHRLRTSFRRTETLKNVCSGRYSLPNFLPPADSAPHSVCEAASTPR